MIFLRRVGETPYARGRLAGYGAAMLLSPNDELRNRDDLVTFLRDLHRDFQQRGHEWENPTLDRFLEALAAWAASSETWYQNTGKDLPANGDWTYFARALSAATSYE